MGSSGTPIMPYPRSGRLSVSQTQNISRLDYCYVVHEITLKDHSESSTEPENSGMGSDDIAYVPCNTSALWTALVAYLVPVQLKELLFL